MRELFKTIQNYQYVVERFNSITTASRFIGHQKRLNLNNVQMAFHLKCSEALITRLRKGTRNLSVDMALNSSLGNITIVANQINEYRQAKLGAKIKSWRKKRTPFNTAIVANKIGIKVGVYSNIENGRMLALENNLNNILKLKSIDKQCIRWRSVNEQACKLCTSKNAIVVRLAANYNQAQFAELLGVCSKTVHKAESGTVGKAGMLAYFSLMHNKVNVPLAVNASKLAQEVIQLEGELFVVII